MKLLSWLFRNLKEDKEGSLSTTAVLDKCNSDFNNEDVSHVELCALVKRAFNVEIKYSSNSTSASGEQVSQTRYFMGLNWETSFENISFERLSCQIILFHEYGLMVDSVTGDELRASFDTGVLVNRRKVPITVVFKPDGNWTLLRGLRNVDLDHLFVDSTTMGFDLVYIRKLLNWIRSLQLCQGKQIEKLTFDMKALKFETIITDLDNNSSKMTVRAELCELLVGSGSDGTNLPCTQCAKIADPNASSENVNPDDANSIGARAVAAEKECHIDDDVMSPLLCSEHVEESTSGRSCTNQVLEDKGEPIRSVKDNDEPTRSVKDNDEPTRSVKDNDEPTRSVKDNDEPTRSVKDNDEPTRSVKDNDEPTRSVEFEQGIVLDECAMPIEENLETIGRVEEISVRMPNFRNQSTQSVTKLLAWVETDADSNNADHIPDYRVYSPSLVKEEPPEEIILTGHATNTDADSEGNFEATIRMATNFWAPPLDAKRRSIPTNKKKSAMDSVDDDELDDRGTVSRKGYVKKTISRDSEYLPERKIGREKLECDMCGKSYKHLSRHRQQCVGKKQKVHKCSQCGKCFDLSTKLAIHRVEVHCVESSAAKSDSPNDLSDENTAALQLQELEGITASEDQIETIKASYGKNACRKCGKIFINAKSVNLHMPHCKLVACRLCGERFYGKLGVRKHGQLVHPDQPLRSYVSSIAGYDLNLQKTCEGLVSEDTGTAGQELEDESARLIEAGEGTDDSPCTCDKCGKQFGTAKTLKLHSVQCKLIPCQLCGEEFYGKIGLVAHRKNAHQRNHMFKTLGSERSGLDHVRSQNILQNGTRKRNPNACHKCGKTFLVSASLKMHVLRCKLFPCSTCGVKVYGKVALAKHRKHVHPRRKFRTENGQQIVCEFDESKAEEKEYVCEICGEVFDDRAYLVNHRRAHKKKESATCRTCGKTVRKNYLQAHMRVHTGECPYICEFCGKGFKIPSKLYDHRFFHTDEVLCKTCGKRFSSRRRRIQHEAIHTGVKGYECQICGHQFYTKQRLLQHHRVKHGDKEVGRPLDGRFRTGGRDTGSGSIVLWDSLQVSEEVNMVEYL